MSNELLKEAFINGQNDDMKDEVRFIGPRSFGPSDVVSPKIEDKKPSY